MITILFFARYRDALNTPSTSVSADGITSVKDLIDTLKTNGPTWQKVLDDPLCIVAVNQTVAEPGTAIKDGDEVAFYPPVTGG